MNDERKDTLSANRIRHLGAVGLVVTVGLAASSGAASAPATGSRQATDSAQASSKIAFIRLSGSAPAEIYVMNVDGSGQRLLTRSTSHLYGWSPDGRKIAFGRGRDGNDDIHVMNADGSGQRNLTRTRNALNQGAVWSPDGRKFAFTRISGVGPRTRDLRHECRRERAAEADAQHDGRHLSYLVARRTEDRLRWRRPHPRHERRRERKPAPDAQRRGCCKPTRAGGGVWSPDGRKIAFTGGDRNGLDVYVMNTDGSGKRNLTRRPVDHGNDNRGQSGLVARRAEDRLR